MILWLAGAAGLLVSLLGVSIVGLHLVGIWPIPTLTLPPWAE